MANWESGYLVQDPKPFKFGEIGCDSEGYSSKSNLKRHSDKVHGKAEDLPQPNDSHPLFPFENVVVKMEVLEDIQVSQEDGDVGSEGEQGHLGDVHVSGDLGDDDDGGEGEPPVGEEMVISPLFSGGVSPAMDIMITDILQVLNAADLTERLEQL